MSEEKQPFRDALRDFSKYGEILENPKLSSEQKLEELSKIKPNKSKDER